MKCLLLTLAISATTAHAADEQQPPKQQLNCDGPYTMYTHPDPSCREKLADEYKQLIEQFLKQHPPVKGESK